MGVGAGTLDLETTSFKAEHSALTAPNSDL